MNGSRVIQPPALTSSATYRSAQRILRAAAKGISSIKAVMAVPPTISAGAAGVNSTIIAGANTAGTGSSFPVLSSDTANANFDMINGFLVGNRIVSATQAGGTRRGGHGVAIRFGTYAAAFDFACDSSATAGTDALMIYVTDVATGVRARVATDDIAIANQNSPFYQKIDFGSRAFRIIEICLNPFHKIYGINVATTDRIWKIPAPDMPAWGINWDSYGAGMLSDTAPLNGTRLATIDFALERFGVPNPVVNASIAGTGIVTTASITNFMDRITAGDLAVSRVGTLDGILAPLSLNDNGVSDATYSAAITAYYLALMVTQPNAIIIAWGQQFANISQATNVRFDLFKTAFLAAAGTDPRMIYLDNRPYAGGEYWQFGSSSTGINKDTIGTDNTHVNKAGAQYLGYRIADSAIAAIRTAFAL